MLRCWLGLALFVCICAAQAAEPLAVTVGAGDVVQLPEPAVAVFVADPDVADIHVPTPGSIFVVGKKEGRTMLFALGKDNHVILRRPVVIKRDLARLEALLHERFPHVKLALESAPGSLMVSGNVNAATDVDAIIRTLTPALNDKETLINRLAVAQPTQV
jgi:pilus assembly protein CpaC